MIVVDTNIIAYLYLESGRSSQVEQALKKDTDWAAPLLWRSRASRCSGTIYSNESYVLR